MSVVFRTVLGVSYVEMVPAAHVAARVHCVWSAAHDSAEQVKRVVPDGCIDLIWTAHSRSIHVAGPDTGPFMATLLPGERLAGVRFRPGTAAEVLGVPAHVLRDDRVPLADLWGAAAERLAEAVATAADRPRALESLIADRVRAAGPPAPMLGAVTAGRVRVRRLAEAVGVSERHLHRRCLEAFGYGPTMVRRILRFQRALRSMHRGQPFAAVAHESGYADQAHLTREVRRLAGVPPTALVQAASRP